MFSSAANFYHRVSYPKKKKIKMNDILVNELTFLSHATDCDIKFKFIRNASNFGLISTNDSYKVELGTQDLRLEMRKIQCLESIVRNYESTLLKKHASFFFPMSKIKTFVISAGSSYYHQGKSFFRSRFLLTAQQFCTFFIY